ncbi:hypothetical protein AKJ16_DCAP25616 [Drosera capensis]
MKSQLPHPSQTLQQNTNHTLLRFRLSKKNSDAYEFFAFFDSHPLFSGHAVKISVKEIKDPLKVNWSASAKKAKLQGSKPDYAHVKCFQALGDRSLTTTYPRTGSSNNLLWCRAHGTTPASKIESDPFPQYSHTIATHDSELVGSVREAAFNPEGVRNCEIAALVLASTLGDARCSEHGGCHGHGCHGDQRQQKPERNFTKYKIAICNGIGARDLRVEIGATRCGSAELIHSGRVRETEAMDQFRPCISSRTLINFCLTDCPTSSLGGCKMQSYSVKGGHCVFRTSSEDSICLDLHISDTIVKY